MYGTYYKVRSNKRALQVPKLYVIKINNLLLNGLPLNEYKEYLNLCSENIRMS